MISRRYILLSSVTTSLLPRSLRAETYPSKPIRIIVPFGPGSATDQVARIVAAEIASASGQPVIVDNRAGAEGQIGAQAAAQSPPDGYTLFFTTQTTQAANPAVYRTLQYDPIRSFAPISGLTRGAQIVLVRNELGVRTISDLIALAKREPGKITFGSGNGSSRAGGELFKVMAGVDMTHVPYRSQPQAIQDLIGGIVDVVFSDFLAALPSVEANRIRAIAVTSSQRSRALPEVPTVHEAGVPGYEMWAWTASYAPAGTPQPILDQLNRWIVAAMKSATIVKIVEQTAGETFAGAPAELAAFQSREIEAWRLLVTRAGMQAP